MIFFRVIGRLALAGLVFLVAAPAGAQDAEAPLGVHPQGHQSHWYDRACCNLTDCARVDVWLEDGYYAWNSWRRPGVILRVPFDSPDIKPSQDGSYHGCENTMPIKDINPDDSYRDGVFCLYVPPAM